MIKHIQNKHGAEGNCWQTAVASVLELPMEEVPDFVNDYDNGGKHWWLTTIEFLDERGYTLEPVIEHLYDDSYYFVIGPSPRNAEMSHVVVYQNGKMVHDPHPDGTGVLEEKHFDALRKKD